MESCDVLIIGAGPAGSTCARLLTDAGLSVLLMDRDDFPRDKPCAGWITPAVLQTLRIDPADYARDRLIQELAQFRTGVMFGSEIVTDYRRTVSYAIRRCEFDDYLLRRSGARTLLGERAGALERQGDGWLVNGWIRSRLIIGAGGNLCPVARALGAVPGRERAIAAMVAEFEDGEAGTSPGAAAGAVTISFTPDLSGYGWLLRKGGFLNVGLGSLQGKDVRRLASEFCAHLLRRGDLRRDVTPLLRGHAYLPYRRHGRAIVAEAALLIGDAAGVSAPESGEGILPAVETALLAARTVLAARGDYRLEKLEPYAQAVSGRFGGGCDLPLPPGVKERAGAALLSSRWLTRRLVLDRWFLHSARKPLAAGPGV